MSLIHEEGHCKPVLCDNLEGQSGEGGGRGFQDGGDTGIPVTNSYRCVTKSSQYCKAIILQLKQINFFKESNLKINPTFCN